MSDDIEITPLDLPNQGQTKLTTHNQSKLIIIWFFSFIFLIIITCQLPTHISPSLRNHVPLQITSFSERRALDYLVNLTRFGSRVSHTFGNCQARDYLITQLDNICSNSLIKRQCEINLQNLNELDQNILVRISDFNFNSINMSSLLLVAHYDTVEFSEGSSDDGVGVVTLLELMSNLINDELVKFSNLNLIVLFTNNEERGLLGAKAFISNHSWYSNIHRFISIDSIVCKDRAILIDMKPSKLVLDYKSVKRPNANILLRSLAISFLNLTGDYGVLSRNNSLFGYEFGCIYDGYLYHSINDVSHVIEQGVIQDLGENLGMLIRHILSNEKKIIDKNIRYIYFDLFGRYLFVYKLSTSIIIQIILIILILTIGIILIVLDHRFHTKNILKCNDIHCIYSRFTNPLRIRLNSILIYSISNFISLLIGLFCPIFIAWIISFIQPLPWFYNYTLALFLFLLSSLFGCILIVYLTKIIHSCLLKQSLIHIDFNFEQNFSILVIYTILMLISIQIQIEDLYLILVWSIFICPIYLIFLSIQIIHHEKQRKYWFYLPLIVSFIPLSHTTDLIYRIIRTLIPIIHRRFYFKTVFFYNLTVCCYIVIPYLLFFLILLPIFIKFRNLFRLLIMILISLSILIYLVYINNPFSSDKPGQFLTRHKSESDFTIEQLSNISLTSQISSINIYSFNGLSISSVLDQFESKTGYQIQNKGCFTKRITSCSIDDTFNRSIAINNIRIVNRTIFINHSSSSNIDVWSNSWIDFIVRNRFDNPRIETIIDLLNSSLTSSFNINIRIRRCHLKDSPFLVKFVYFMRNIALLGAGECRTIEDIATLFFHF